MCLVDDVVIALRKQVGHTVCLTLLRHQEHIVVGHLNVISPAGLAGADVRIVFAHDPLGTVPAGASHADLLLHEIGKIHGIQIEATGRQIQCLQQVNLPLVFVRIELQHPHQIVVPAQAEIMIFSFPNSHPQGAVDHSHTHQCLGQLGDLFLNQFPLQVNAGSRNGNGILGILVDAFQPGRQECRCQIAHGLSGSDPSFVKGDLLFLQTFQHGLSHPDLFFPNRKAKLRENAAEHHIHWIQILRDLREMHAPETILFVAKCVKHKGNQQGVISVAVTDLTVQNSALCPADLVEHLILGIDPGHLMEHHIAVHQRKIVISLQPGDLHNGQIPKYLGIFLIHLKHSKHSFFYSGAGGSQQIFPHKALKLLFVLTDRSFLHMELRHHFFIGVGGIPIQVEVQHTRSPRLPRCQCLAQILPHTVPVGFLFGQSCEGTVGHQGCPGFRIDYIVQGQVQILALDFIFPVFLFPQIVPSAPLFQGGFNNQAVLAILIADDVMNEMAFFIHRQS